MRFINGPRVAAAIKEAQQARGERVGIESNRVLAELEHLAFSRIDHYTCRARSRG